MGEGISQAGPIAKEHNKNFNYASGARYDLKLIDPDIGANRHQIHQTASATKNKHQLSTHQFPSIKPGEINEKIHRAGTSGDHHKSPAGRTHHSQHANERLSDGNPNQRDAESSESGG